MNEQIKEMASIIGDCQSISDSNCDKLTCAECKAMRVYNADYRKQSEGEWIKVAAYNDGVLNTVKCSVCKTLQPVWMWDYHPYCPTCGAKMKGGAEQ